MKRILVPSLLFFCFALLIINIWSEMSFSQSAVTVQPANGETFQEAETNQVSPPSPSTGENRSMGMMGGMNMGGGMYGGGMGGYGGMMSPPPDGQEMEFRVYSLKNRPVADVAKLIQPLVSGRQIFIQPDQQNNNLILASPKGHPDVKQIELLLQKLDTQKQASPRQESMSLLYRVYSVDTGESKKVDTIWQALPNTMDKGETVPNEAPDASKPNIHLPDALQSTISNFLGKSAQVHGYWFGHASVPGETQVQLGDYILHIETQSMYDKKFTAKVRYLKSITSERGYGEDKNANSGSSYNRRAGQSIGGVGQTTSRRVSPREQIIVENTVNCQVGQPVIIGYSSNGSGSISQGALILIPESTTVKQPVTRSSR
ncbi:hypothetical protein GF373_14450 [bacterium]|nr:hypothetical protein [bacterium]